MYTVYFADRAVTFDSRIPNGAEGELWAVGREERIPLAKLSQKLQFTKHLYVISNDIEKVFSDFCASARMIEAGGGMTLNDRGEILMIFRNGRWDLPKGKMEKQERIEGCAAREVEEECGLSGITCGEFLTHSYHAYRIDGEWVLKRTTWFSMRYHGGQEPTPQAQEGITFAGWVSPQELPEKMQNSYFTIMDVLRAAGYDF